MSVKIEIKFGFLMKLTVTLIIVGVIAAMCIPAIVKSKQHKQKNDSTLIIKQHGE